MNVKTYCFIIVIASLLIFNVSDAYSQSSATVKAGVGKYYFSVSGIVSPYASVVMSTQNTFMASAVADNEGQFSIDNVLVNEGFEEFCFEAVDIRRIGNSYTCLKTEALTSDSKKDDIFLPPTIGLSGRKISPGSPITASGYSMPLASVSITIGDGIIIRANSDINGFYTSEIADLATGKYLLFATAKYQNKNSEKPARKLEIESLSLLDGFPNWLWLLLLLIILAIIILIIILLWKRRKRNKGVKKRSSRRLPGFKLRR